ncbi:MAG: ABC transporter ATP-binding protein [Clostridiales bacterium]|nr:ABC transporter ATP-binding protein [Clostridiales bacterium]
MTEALTLKNVTKRYKDFTLDNVSLTLPGGCIMGLIGENGAGKSTTIKLIFDLIRLDSGLITVMGHDHRHLPLDKKEHIGAVFDESCFPENLNHKEINRIMGSIYRTWNASEFEKLVKQFSLPKDKAVKDYSRGMKMKLSIAAALSHDTRLLILDEATGGLDPVVRDEILDIFLEFIRDENHSILMSSHIVTDIEKACDYVTLLHDGRVLFSSPKDELLDQFALLKCPTQELSRIDPAAIVGKRVGEFGAEALVRRSRIQRSLPLERAPLETVMLYFIKGDAR